MPAVRYARKVNPIVAQLSGLLYKVGDLDDYQGGGGKTAFDSDGGGEQEHVGLFKKSGPFPYSRTIVVLIARLGGYKGAVGSR